GLGAIASTSIYAYAGWSGVCLLGATVSAAALVVWAATLERKRAPETGSPGSGGRFATTGRATHADSRFAASPMPGAAATHRIQPASCSAAQPAAWIASSYTPATRRAITALSKCSRA
ncbi:hypothetical protein CA830_38055, partial [Burkholderia multivorans]